MGLSKYGWFRHTNLLTPSQLLPPQIPQQAVQPSSLKNHENRPVNTSARPPPLPVQDPFILYTPAADPYLSSSDSPLSSPQPGEFLPGLGLDDI
eukprot:gene5617-biopygen13258